MGNRTTARAAVESAMPPLAEACTAFKGFGTNKRYGEQIFQILLGVIQRHRGARQKRFYTMREVAVFFGVSLATAETAFRRLGREGALTLVRSSQTVIPARVSRPRFAVSGLVCMPVYLPGFLLFLNWRKWFTELEQELSRHRFVLQPIFFRQSEEIDSTFVDRLLKFNPDYVLWTAPVRNDRMTMQSIIDAGVPILSILSILDKKTLSLPGRIYYQRYQRALRRGLIDWQATGEINRIIVAQAGKEYQTEYRRFIQQNCSLPHEFFDYSGSHLQYFERMAPNLHTGIIFADALFFAQLCVQMPEKMFQLFRRHRVMVMCQVTLPGLIMPSDVTVDALLLPGRRLARRIAEDLSQSKGALPSTEETFEAEWHPRTPLTEVAQDKFQE